MNMNRYTNSITPIIAIFAMCCAVLSSGASAQRLLEKEEVRQLNGVDLLEAQGAMLPLDTVLTTADGNDVALAQYFMDDKPTILALVYYECPIVCPTVLRSLSETINKLDYSTGEDYRILVVSFDHREGTTQALVKRESFIGNYKRIKDQPNARKGIEFFTASEESIQAIAGTVGFAFNEISGGEYAHPISLMAISPKGQLTRYIYGYDYPVQDLKLTLLDASEGKIAASLGDRIMHFCFRYDPLEGSYSLAAFRVMQAGALIGAITLGIFIGLLFLGEKRRAKQRNTNDSDSNDYPDSSTTTTGTIAGAPTGHMS
ncbi:MAG: SCO family protein [Phycisphaerales bacterium]